MGHRFYQNENILHSLVFEQLKKHSIKSAMITVLLMYKNYLMSKEKMEEFFDPERYTGEDMWYPRDSINDNLENFVDQICQKTEREHSTETFFVSKLTKEEMKLFESKDEEHMETYFRGSRADVSAREMQLSESKSKYVNAHCSRTSLMVKNYELSGDKVYHFEFIIKSEYGEYQRETIFQVSFKKQDMSYSEIESLAGVCLNHRHAWALETLMLLKNNNLQSAKLKDLCFQDENLFQEKLEEKNWQDAKISLNTSRISNSEFHHFLIFKDNTLEFHRKDLHLWLMLCYLLYKAPRGYPDTWS